MSTERLEATLPPAFDSGIYRALHADLQPLTDDELQRHYTEHGTDEGRRAHSLVDRTAFAALAKDLEALELFPADLPLLSGPEIRYFDTIDHTGLVARAERLGKPTERVPERVDFVSPTGDLSVVVRTFDAVLSNHLAQLQPDLIKHLNAVERLLRPGGLYLLCIPDKRHGSGHFVASSTIADVLDAHHSGRLVPSLRSQIEHAALSTHDNSTAHWAGEHGVPTDVAKNTEKVVQRYQAEPERSVGVPSWYFTPTTFLQIMSLLRDLGHTVLKVLRLYPSLKNSNEFWVILEAPAS